MKKNHIIICALSIILIVSFIFYWYEYRPTKIRKYCNTKAQAGSLRELATQNYDNNTYYDNKHERCLRENGLEK